MSAYNSSLLNLPSNVLLVDRVQDLLEIQQRDINLVLWLREEDTNITDFMRKAHCKGIGERSRDGFETRVRKMRKHKGRAAFLERHREIREVMESLQSNRRSVLSIEENPVKGYFFHQDTGYSLAWTIVGPATLWVENQHAHARNHLAYSPPDDHALIRQFPANAIGVYKGMTREEKEASPDLFPFVHSRPDRKAVRRATLQIY